VTKPWFKSVTILGGIAFAALQSAETLGVVPAGTGAELVKIAAGLATLYGLRRAAG
jgi:hypothetical protein